MKHRHFVKHACLWPVEEVSPTFQAKPLNLLVNTARDSIRLEEVEILALTGLFIWFSFDQVGPADQRMPLSYESVKSWI
jgi:hypothetical protein